MDIESETLFEAEQRIKRKLQKSKADAVERHALISIIDGDYAEFERLTKIMQKRKKIPGYLRVIVS